MFISSEKVSILKSIAATLGELQDSGKIRKLVGDALSRRIPALEILEKGLRRGFDVVGNRYEAGEYFLSELLFAGSMMNDALEILGPRLKQDKTEKKGRIVLGTVRGDIHDIGKNIFKMLSQSAGFEVHDLDVDVEPGAFITALKETNAEILGMSTLLTTTRGEMKHVIDKLIETGMRDKVKVLLGGNAVTKRFAEEIGADAAALDAVEGVKICREWVGK